MKMCFWDKLILWFIVIVITIGLVFYLVDKATAQEYVPGWEPLGTIHCEQDKPAEWLHVIARLEGRKEEIGLDAWVCDEDRRRMEGE